MNEEQASRVITDYPTRVVARYSDGSIRGEGTAYAYSIVPVIYIETDSGERFSWRHDMTQETP